MSTSWLTKDIIVLLVAHVDELQTALALCRTSKAFHEAVTSQHLLEVLASGKHLVDFKPLQEGDWSVAETWTWLQRERKKDERIASQFSLAVIVFGRWGSGKTASVIQYCSNHFVEEYDPTLEDSYRKQIVLGKLSYLLELWDTAGCEDNATERFLDLAHPYNNTGQPFTYAQITRQNDAFVVLYSVTCRMSFAEAKEVLQFAETHLEERELWNCILVGNKVDLAECREVSIAEGRQVAQQYQIAFCEASAKTGENLKEWMEYLVINQIRRNLKGLGYAQTPQKTSKKGCHVQ
jgi:GTPase KRas protein